LVGFLAACSKPKQPETAAAEPEPQQQTGLESVPPADASKYPGLSNLKDWQNPYLVVRDDGIGVVNLASREVRVLKPEEIPAELVSFPTSAWPYGRVVLVTHAKPKDPSENAKKELDKNHELLMGMLKELDVEVHEGP
jgi:hypothetical protein